MPANLTPQYRRAEEKYRQAQSPQERIARLEEMLQVIPRHKGTDRLQGELRARLKEHRQELATSQQGARPGRSVWIPRQGAGTAVIIGAPNSGKSSLLKALTSAQPEVAPYPFTTRSPQAGMLEWDALQVQLIDTPPLTPGQMEPTLLSYVRAADLVLLCLDGSDDDSISSTTGILQELARRKTRLSMASGFDEHDFSIVHVKGLCVVTRGRAADAGLRLELLQQPCPLPISAVLTDFAAEEDVDHLRRLITGSFEVMRIYTRRPGTDICDPDPIVLPVGAVVIDLAEKIHLELAARLKFAKVWRSGSVQGRTALRTDPLQDRDIVELY